MIRLVSRIVVLVVLSLTLTGCLRMLDTSPLLPTPPTGGVAANSTNSVSVPPTTVSTVAATLAGAPPTDTPTVEQPTVPPVTAVPPPATEAAVIPTLGPVTVAATVANANPPTNTAEAPTLTPVIPTNTAQPPTIPPTVPPTVAPTIPPTEPPSPVPAASETPPVEASPTANTNLDATNAAASLTAAAPTPTATNTFAVTLAPPIDGATGTIDAQCNYKIEQNDRLLAIGRRFNRTVQELLKANPTIVNPQLIFLGQIIKIPDCTKR